MDAKSWSLIVLALTLLMIAGALVFVTVRNKRIKKQRILQSRRWIIKYPFDVKVGDSITINSNVTNDPAVLAGRHEVKVTKVFEGEKKVEVECAHWTKR